MRPAERKREVLVAAVAAGTSRLRVRHGAVRESERALSRWNEAIKSLPPAAASSPSASSRTRTSCCCYCRCCHCSCCCRYCCYCCNSCCRRAHAAVAAQQLRFRSDFVHYRLPRHRCQSPIVDLPIEHWADALRARHRGRSRRLCHCHYPPTRKPWARMHGSDGCASTPPAAPPTCSAAE